MTRTVLVAGATGWMGRKIAQALLERAAVVRLMVRGGARHPKAGSLVELTDRGASVVDADVEAPASLEQAVAGVDVIVSALQGGPDIIVDGQRALAASGLAGGVKRIFPSDFSVDFTGFDDDEHVFLGWRRQANRAIAAVGLPQTNTFNGAFTEMLLEPFLGLVDFGERAVAYWGDADQPYDFTTIDDVAAYVAAAATDDEPPNGAFQIAGQVASPRDLGAVLTQVEGHAFALRCNGSLDDLDALIADRRSQAPNDPMVWAGLQYHRVMASGRGKLSAPMNGRYTSIVPISIGDFIAAGRQSETDPVRGGNDHSR